MLTSSPVCGHPSFEKKLRDGLRLLDRDLNRDITLLSSSFQPDETSQSRACVWRYVATGMKIRDPDQGSRPSKGDNRTRETLPTIESHGPGIRSVLPRELQKTQKVIGKRKEDGTYF